MRKTQTPTKSSSTQSHLVGTEPTNVFIFQFSPPLRYTHILYSSGIVFLYAGTALWLVSKQPGSPTSYTPSCSQYYSEYISLTEEQRKEKFRVGLQNIAEYSHSGTCSGIMPIEGTSLSMLAKVSLLRQPVSII